MHPNDQRTTFDDLVDDIKARNGVSHLEAMERARREHPREYRQSQGLTSTAGRTYKAAPLTFEAAVDAEISKGCSPVLAEQRVQQAYGQTLPSVGAFTKASVIEKFARLVDQTMRRDGCDRARALEKVRRAEPDLYEAFQIV